MTKRCEQCGVEIEENEVICEECYEEEVEVDDREEWPDDEEE